MRGVGGDGDDEASGETRNKHASSRERDPIKPGAKDAEAYTKKIAKAKKRKNLKTKGYRCLRVRTYHIHEIRMLILALRLFWILPERAAIPKHRLDGCNDCARFRHVEVSGPVL